ncbi:MAG: beta-N-acetylhexosaminidase [Pseudomonadota bacterium]
MSYLIIGLAGQTLTDQERLWLSHPCVGGAIFFKRNWQSPEQVMQLAQAVRDCCPGALLMIDQEGGRVQRFGTPLATLPPLASLGQVFDQSPSQAAALARAHGELMASEILSLGIDLSLAPVLDLNAGSEVIGDRAFHAETFAVETLAKAYRSGMREAGMAACGKHFPGHGTVVPDTHVADATDPRSLEELLATDLRPFAAAIADGIEGLMLAHVVYPEVCARPAGFSRAWIQDVLRERLAFDGVVISDDLGMRAAHQAGGFGQRVEASLEAGCDLLLVCRPDDVQQVMATDLPDRPTNPRRLERLRGRVNRPAWASLATSARHQELKEQLACLT